MYRDFGTVFLATLVAIIFVIVPLVIGWLVAPSNKTKEKLELMSAVKLLKAQPGFNSMLGFMLSP